MKKFLIISLIIVAVAGYLLYPKAPEFVRVNGIDISSLKKDVLKTELEFTNPNFFSLKLVHQDIQVYISERNIGQIAQKEGRTISAKENFSLPIDLAFNRREVFGRKGFGKSLLSALIKDDLNVRFSGLVTVKVIGITFPVIVDYSEKLIEHKLGKK